MYPWIRPWIVVAAVLSAAPAGAADVDHSAWDALVHSHVNAKGLVDYRAFANSPELDGYLGRLAATDPASLPSRGARLALWINAYNAYAIKGIVSDSNIKTTVQQGGPKFAFFDKKIANVGGKTYSLNQIENDIVRKRFGDPRVHAALNCTAISCPRIQPSAFTEKNLDQLLDQGMRGWVNDPHRNDIQAGRARLSEIFKWYQGDFAAKGGVVPFVSKYLSDEKRGWLKHAQSGGEVGYLPYDWTLNKQ